MKISKRRHFRKAKGERKSTESATIFLQRIPKDKFDRLSEADRYCFLLLGHIHDEISWLQRMAYVATRSAPRGSKLERAGNMMQATFLARLLLGKLFEFKKVMGAEGSPISQFIANYFRPDDKALGTAQVEAILGFYKKEKWIRVARNKHFLHYPALADVVGTLNDPELEWHVEIAHGKKSSNTFYPASDVMANYAWFRLANPNEPMKGLAEALDTIRELAQLTLSSLEQSIGYFVDKNLLELSTNAKIRIPALQSIHDVRLDYFVKT